MRWYALTEDALDRVFSGITSLFASKLYDSLTKCFRFPLYIMEEIAAFRKLRTFL